jgi:DNA-directed RNA polymerase specialized sigma24 family protein
MDSDQSAWDAVYAQYWPQVTSWIKRNPMFPMLEEETQYFVNRTFERLWGVMTPAKWAQFPDLKAVLRYLQMCTHSVLVDYARQKELAKQTESIDETDETPLPDPEAAVEERVLSEQRRQDLWQWLERQLGDRREYEVIYGKFVLGLKPPDILSRHPSLFADVREVYRASETVLARLRRSGELEQFLSDV